MDTKMPEQLEETFNSEAGFRYFRKCLFSLAFRKFVQLTTIQIAPGRALRYVFSSCLRNEVEHTIGLHSNFRVGICHPRIPFAVLSI